MELTLLITLFLSLLLCVLGVLFIIWLWESLIYRAPFIPVPMPVVTKVIELIKLQDGSSFYDLGSGDGRVVRAVAKKYLNSSCFGVEKAIFPNLLAHIYSLISRQKNVTYQKEDFHDVSLIKADAVFLYLWPSVMVYIAPKLKQELPAGAQIISCSFTLPDFPLIATEEVNYKGTTYSLYHYTNT